jgi:hypothetical protein
MKGWKLWLSAGLSVGYGVAGYFFDLHDATTAVGFVNAGIASVGIGHKIEKLAQPPKSRVPESERDWNSQRSKGLPPYGDTHDS